MADTYLVMYDESSLDGAVKNVSELIQTVPDRIQLEEDKGLWLIHADRTIAANLAFSPGHDKIIVTKIVPGESWLLGFADEESPKISSWLSDHNL